MTSPDQVTAVVGPALSADEFVLDDVSITPAGKRRVVRIAVDRALASDGDITESIAPLTLDEVSAASHLVSGILDESDVMGQQPYVLEVTSPGVDRPLVEPRHFRRNVGRLVKVSAADGQFVGRLTRAGENDATFEVSVGEGAGPRDVAYGDITRATVQVEFNRPGAPEPTDEDEEN